MKQIRLRVAVTAEDAIRIEQVQARLLECLNGLGTETLMAEAADDLAGVVPGARVFWQTAEVKQGNGREDPPTVVKSRSRAATR